MTGTFPIEEFDDAITEAAERFRVEGEPFLRAFGELWLSRIESAREAGTLPAADARSCTDRLMALAQNLPGAWSEHVTVHQGRGSVRFEGKPNRE